VKRGALAFGVSVLLAIATEGAAAVGAGAGSPFLQSNVCLTAPTFTALLLTPTAKLGEVFTARMGRYEGKNNGN
jgi:hypothetical protein